MLIQKNTLLPDVIVTNRAEMHNGDILNLPCNMNYYFLEDNVSAKAAAEILKPIMSEELRDMPWIRLSQDDWEWTLLLLVKTF
jgi:hypothetical protein